MDPNKFFSFKSIKLIRLEVKTFEKNGKIQRELTKQLFDKLTKAFDAETRPEVRQVLDAYLNELRMLMKQQEELREKWITRLDLLKNQTTGSLDLRFLIWSWLTSYDYLISATNNFIKMDEEALPDESNELQFLVMAISYRTTKVILSILKRQLTTSSIMVDVLCGRPHNDRNFQAINKLADQLAAKGNEDADTKAISNLKNGIKNLSSLYSYIDAEREKRMIYLPNLDVDDSNLLSDSLFSGMQLKLKDLNFCCLALNLNKEQEELKLSKKVVGKFSYIYLDTTHRIEMDHIKDMLELVGYMVRRAVLFPILEQKEVSRKMCCVCLKQEDKHLWLCAACLGVTYCGRECQQVSWPLHQLICGPSRIDNIKRKQRIKYQTIDKDKENEVRCRVDQFYNNA